MSGAKKTLLAMTGMGEKNYQAVYDRLLTGTQMDFH
jgi:hypothetical protein